MAITADELLARVKNSIGITGDYQDNTIEEYIFEVKAYLASAGVSAAVLQSDKVVGVIARGVLDLWNYGAGDGALSPYFNQRCLQLVYAPVDEPEPGPDPGPSRLTRVCTFTDKMAYYAGAPYYDNDNKGIYQKGKHFYIRYLELLKVGKYDLKQGINAWLAQIDDPAYYPAVDILTPGYLKIGDADTTHAMYKIFSHGAICVVTSEPIPAGTMLDCDFSNPWQMDGD